MTRPNSGVPSSLLLALTLLSSPSPAQEDRGQEIRLTKALMLPSVGRSGRVPVHTDLLEAMLVRGQWQPPTAGDELEGPRGKVSWSEVQVGDDGWFRGRALRGGYLYCPVESDSERVVVLHARGHGSVFVNGEPRAGDPYGNDLLRQPVLLRKGINHFLFQVARGTLRAVLEPPAGLFFQPNDRTLPDLSPTDRGPFLAAVVVVNATTEAITNARLEATTATTGSTITRLPYLPPLSSRKVGFSIAGSIPDQETAEVRIRLFDGAVDQPVDEERLELRVRSDGQRHVRTFASQIDGSVQYYAVNPARAIAGGDTRPPAVFLSLHGAAVEATGQAGAYGDKTWGHLVAPTNRRPYGFDWEDWGRLDALEALEDACDALHHDPTRVYLTGHSMGGHGTWHLGVTFPDRFAAIGPSAGWLSFWSYAGRRGRTAETPMAKMLQRATSPSDTLALATNLRSTGVYVLHGDADDNVPVAQARAAVERLGEFHDDFRVHEQKGAGHWWDDSDAAGASCVDWAPMFDLFAHRRLPHSSEVRDVDFATANPGVSATNHWVTIHAQQQMLAISRVQLRCDPWQRRFSGTTGNVALLSLDLKHLPPGDVQVILDDQDLGRLSRPDDQPRIHFAHSNGTWARAEPSPEAHKGPHRYGPFKEAFANRVIFAYGTAGTHEENAWALAKARYDAETFQYRGNGSVDVLPDTGYAAVADAAKRNVILYGNADTNRLWPALLGDSPVSVRRGAVVIGDQILTGDDLGAVFIRPKPGSDRALVGVVSGSGLVGMRTTNRLRYFVSGASYPDLMVFGADMLNNGQDGVRAAGFFGVDWAVASGEIVFAQ